MRCLTKEETELAAGGAVPVAVAVGAGAIGGGLSAHLSGGNAGQVAAGAILVLLCHKSSLSLRCPQCGQ
jgi:hypothetical protein